MVAEIVDIGKLGLGVQGVVTVLYALHDTSRSSVVGVPVPEHVLLSLGEVVGYFLAQVQLVPDVVGHLQGVECSFQHIPVLAVLLLEQGIDPEESTTVVQVAFLVIGSGRWVLRHGIVEQRTIIRGSLIGHVLVHLGKQGGKAQRESAPRVGDVGVASKSFQSLVGHDALLLGVGQRGVEASLVATSREAYLVVGVVARLEEQVLPVRIATCGHGRKTVYVAVGESHCVFSAVAIVQGIVFQSQRQQFSAVCSVQRGTIIYGHVREAPIAPEIYVGLSCLSTLGGNHDNTIGGARTIEGSGRRVLDDGHGLYVVGVDGSENVRSCVIIA